MVLYILTFKSLLSRWEGRRLWTERQQAFPEFSLLLISSCMQFWSVSVDPMYLNSATSSKDPFTIFMLRFCPVFWLRVINIYLVFSGFASRPTSLLASVFFFIVIYVSNKIN
jgi:hypothetical protein